MKILVSQRMDFLSTRLEYRDSIDQELISWLVNKNYFPILIPNKLVDTKLKNEFLLNWINEIKPNFLLLTGGNDIGEFNIRDQTEYFLLDWAKKNNIPSLGICRGMQVMGTFFGGKLEKLNGHLRKKHRLISEINFFDKRLVNSFHKYGFLKCPPFFKVLARSKDGVIEAVSHEELNWEGWMWHPERENNNKLDTERLLKIFKNEK